jgi:hypothetical protein
MQHGIFTDPAQQTPSDILYTQPYAPKSGTRVHNSYSTHILQDVLRENIADLFLTKSITACLKRKTQKHELTSTQISSVQTHPPVHDTPSCDDKPFDQPIYPSEASADAFLLLASKHPLHHVK